MGSFIETFIRGLAELPNSPLALIGYVVLVALFFYYSVRRISLGQTLAKIETLPERQRLEMIKVLHGAHLKSGMSSADYIRHQKNFYYLIVALALILSGLIAFTVGITSEKSSAEDLALNDVCTALNRIQNDLPNGFRNIRTENSEKNADGTTSYESNVTIPGAFYNYVEEFQGEPQFIASFYADTSRREAEKVFAQRTEQFRRCLKDWMVHDDVFDKEKLVDRYVSFVKGNKKVILAIVSDGPKDNEAAGKETIIAVNILIVPT